MRVTVTRALGNLRTHPAQEGQVSGVYATDGAEDSKCNISNGLAFGTSTSAQVQQGLERKDRVSNTVLLDIGKSRMVHTG